jgi:16S rRNA (uracil1498-N3)-methyltransferase
MADRFYIVPPLGDADRAVLEGAEAHHLLHVMRGKVGDEVVLFDGRGWEYLAAIVRTGRSRVELQIIVRSAVDRELPFPVTLAVALPKGDRQRWLVEKLVELGVATLVPLITQRGVAQPVAGVLDRLRRTVVEASKQCGRNRLMAVAEPQSLSELVEAVGRDAASGTLLLAHPHGKPLVEALGERADRTAGRWVCAVGPEGGFTDDELAIARNARWEIVGLGPRTLRVETAALALAAAAAWDLEGR